MRVESAFEWSSQLRVDLIVNTPFFPWVYTREGVNTSGPAGTGGYSP